MEVRNFNINNFDELCVSGYEIERGLGELRTDIKPAALKVIVIHIIGRLEKKKGINFPTSLQSRGGKVHQSRLAPLFFKDTSRSVKANGFATSANICMLLSSLLYPCCSKCFSFVFLQCLQE